MRISKAPLYLVAQKIALIRRYFLVKQQIINRKGATPQTWNPCDSLILAHNGISVKPVENSPKKNDKKSQKMFRKTIALFGNIGYT